MDIHTLTAFFIWCTILNGGLLLLWTTVFMFAPHLVYRTQARWITISQETFSLVFYSFLGLFKILYLIFNVVPLLALLIVG